VLETEAKLIYNILHLKAFYLSRIMFCYYNICVYCLVRFIACDVNPGFFMIFVTYIEIKMVDIDTS